MRVELGAQRAQLGLGGELADLPFPERRGVALVGNPQRVETASGEEGDRFGQRDVVGEPAPAAGQRTDAPHVQRRVDGGHGDDRGEGRARRRVGIGAVEPPGAGRGDEARGVRAGQDAGAEVARPHGVDDLARFDPRGVEGGAEACGSNRGDGGRLADAGQLLFDGAHHGGGVGPPQHDGVDDPGAKGAGRLLQQHRGEHQDEQVRRHRDVRGRQPAQADRHMDGGDGDDDQRQRQGPLQEDVGEGEAVVAQQDGDGQRQRRVVADELRGPGLTAGVLAEMERGHGEDRQAAGPTTGDLRG